MNFLLGHGLFSGAFAVSLQGVYIMDSHIEIENYRTPFFLDKLDIEMNHDGFQLEVVLDCQFIDSLTANRQTPKRKRESLPTIHFQVRKC